MKKGLDTSTKFLIFWFSVVYEAEKIDMFKCDMCGECCRHIGGNDIYKYLDNGFGVCKYLVGNKCSIYEQRPLICRVDESYEVFFKNVMSKEIYYEQNYQACEKLKKEMDG